MGVVQIIAEQTRSGAAYITGWRFDQHQSGLVNCCPSGAGRNPFLFRGGGRPPKPVTTRGKRRAYVGYALLFGLMILFTFVIYELFEDKRHAREMAQNLNVPTRYRPDADDSPYVALLPGG